MAEDAAGAAAAIGNTDSAVVVEPPPLSSDQRPFAACRTSRPEDASSPAREQRAQDMQPEGYTMDDAPRPRSPAETNVLRAEVRERMARAYEEAANVHELRAERCRDAMQRAYVCADRAREHAEQNRSRADALKRA